MLILNIVNFLAVGFLAYLIGRFSDNYVNVWIKDPPWLPHHWIYGAILIFTGFIFLQDNLKIWTISFGIGLFISDLKDFLDFKFFGADGKEKDKIKFWHID